MSWRARHVTIPASRLSEPAISRPEDLIYAVDEVPPWPRLMFLGA
jgi:hypothetical protein